MLYRGGTDAEPRLGAVLPGDLTRIRLAEGCAFTFGLDSRGRVPVILGDSMGEGCYSSYYYNERLVLVTLPNLELDEITPVTSYYEVTAQPYAQDEVSLEVLYVTDVTSWNQPTWSPDGRYLAFVAAIEGPSSDLYVYDSLQDKIERSRRLSGLIKAAKGNRSRLINMIYLNILSRYPTKDEIAAAEEYFQSKKINTRQATNDLAWALINTKEFLYRH